MTPPGLTVQVGADGLVLGRGGADVDLTIDDPAVAPRQGRVFVEAGALWYEDFLLGTAPVILEKVVVGQSVLTVGDSSGLQEAGLELKMRASATEERMPASTVLYQFARGLLRSTTRQLMHEAVARIRELVPAAQRVSLVGWPPEAEGTFRSLGDLEQGPVSASLARYAVEHGEALLLAEAEDHAPAYGLSIIRHGIRSAVYVPLMDGDTVLGVMCVDTPTPSLPFSPDDFQFIRALGQLLTTALVAEGLREEARLRELEATRRQGLEAFLRIASHDLRNPLMVIKVSSWMLEQLNLGPEAGELIAQIGAAGARAHQLIRTYLQASRATGELKLEWGEVRVPALLEEEIAFIRRGWDNERPMPEFVVSSCPETIRADDAKLRQVVANLVSNAAKYSPDGGQVTVSCALEDGAALFRVRDQGVGISLEDQEELFRQFKRVGDLGQAAGTGLGLWLSCVLVEAHGGRMWVESAPGEGSTFSFTMPQ